MELVIANFGFGAGGWRVERHPRMVADVTGDGSVDVVGFGEGGVWVALGNGDGTFGDPALGVDDFGATAGGWRVDRHPRFLADLTGSDGADVVGFGEAGAWVSLSRGDGTFAGPTLALANLGATAGGWRVERHPRTVADVTGDGRMDLVGFGEGGVWVALGNGDGTFAPAALGLDDFGATAGGWRVDRHPRFLADLTGSDGADVVGFGEGGVWVALSRGDGTFAPPTRVIDDFGATAGNWRVGRHPRLVADVTGDGRADIVGFGDGGVWVALGNGDGTFAPPKLGVDDFGFGNTAGSWRVGRHPRFLADLTGSDGADIVGFGEAGVWVARSHGDGTFAAPTLVIDDFGATAGGWRVDRHPRVVVDVNGDGRADIVGFGHAGVHLALNGGDGSFRSTFVREDIWALEADDPWDPVTLAYANAIKVLRSRPASDPTSWTYLAAVHGTNDPVLPGANWNRCQHGSWYFLPWHRMYLRYFERIVRKAVVDAGGPADWALPYWDYSVPGHAALPPAFRERTMPDGSANPLFVAQRSNAINQGGTLPPSAVDASAAMSATSFTPPPQPGFGGGVTSPQHFFGAGGELEFTPHNIIHVLIGGWMTDPNQAASDPIFWLHHCNIDRLWEVWLRQAGRANPAQAAWGSQTFTFHDEDGGSVVVRCDEIVDTVGQLGYRYDGLTAAATRAVGGPVRQPEGAPAGEPEPELVGASEQETVLAGTRVATEVEIDQRALGARTRVAGPPEAARVYLSLEDIVADRSPAAGYEVFVAAPDHPEAAPQYVGNVSFFGIEHVTSPPDPDDGPHGFRRVFDITDAVAALRAQQAWDDQRVRVSFRPLEVVAPPAGAPSLGRDVGGPDDAAAEAADAAARSLPVRVGRVSVHYG